MLRLGARVSAAFPGASFAPAHGASHRITSASQAVARTGKMYQDHCLIDETGYSADSATVCDPRLRRASASRLETSSKRKRIYWSSTSDAALGCLAQP